MLFETPTLLSFNLINLFTSWYFSLLFNTSKAAFVRPSLALTSKSITPSTFSVIKSISKPLSLEK